MNEDSFGTPQKGSPCGPGGFDDVKPVPTNGIVTTFHAGETIQVEIQETIYHPGYFRVALDADRSQLKDPPLTDPTACSLDLASVPTGAHDNVLVDGIAKTDATSGANRHLMQDVKLPDTPCDKCTLQVVQVMKDHGPPNCYYFHCADIKILPAASGGDAGASGAAGTSTAGGGSGGVAGVVSSSGDASGTGTGGSSTGGASEAAGGSGATTVSPVAGDASVSAGTSAAANSAGSVASGGTGTTATVGSVTSASGAGSSAPPASPTASSKKSGCAVSEVGAIHSSRAVFLWLLSSLLLIPRTSRVRRRLMRSLNAKQI